MDRNDQDAEPSSNPREKYRPSLSSVSPFQPGSALLSLALPQQRRRCSAILRSPLCKELWLAPPRHPERDVNEGAWPGAASQQAL